MAGINIFKLSNGLTVVLEEMDYVRSISFGIFIHVGSVKENPSNNGISHVLEHMFFKGTKKRSARQLADDMAKLGGDLNAYTSKEFTTFYVTTLDEQFASAAELISDMILNSRFDPLDLEKEKGIILEEIDMYDDSPEDLVHEMLQKQVWNGHPLGYIVSGEKRNVEAFTAEELIKYKEQFYTASNMVISIAGHVNSGKAKEILEEYFKEIPRGKKSVDVPVPTYTKCQFRRKKDIEQVYMNLAFPCITYHSDEKYCLTVVNAMLGGNDNSRLFQILREEMGLVYSVYSYESLYSGAGLFHIDTVLNPSKQKKVLDQMIKIVKGFCAKGINQDELLCTKQQLKTELIIGSEATRNRMSSNGKSLLCRGQITTLEEVMEGIEQVNNEKILLFSRKYLNTDRYSMALVGNIEVDN